MSFKWFIFLFLMMTEKIIFILLVVGFFTLLERKILGYMQIRKGPNKVSYMGILQPISDALKLLIKEKNFSKKMTTVMFFINPMFMLILTFMMWVSIPYLNSSYSIKFSFLLMIVISSFSVFSILGVGWFSNSKYSMIGGLRSMAQTISYEVSFILLMLFFMLWVNSFEFNSMKKNYPLFNILMFILISLMLMVSIIAETNRAPFDFSEGESELVSGFNVEYSSFEFAFLFMSEYCNMMIFSFFMIILFMNLGMIMLMIASLFLLSSWMIIIRGSYPRLRYDKLMNMMWKSFLNMSLMMLFLLVLFI